MAQRFPTILLTVWFRISHKLEARQDFDLDCPRYTILDLDTIQISPMSLRISERDLKCPCPVIFIL